MKGKLANGVGSQYSHMASERGVSSITNADAHISATISTIPSTNTETGVGIAQSV